GDGREVGPRGGDLLASLERLMDAQQRLLDDVLGFGDAAEHPVGDSERSRPQLLELVFFSSHVGRAPVISRFRGLAYNPYDKTTTAAVTPASGAGQPTGLALSLTSLAARSSRPRHVPHSAAAETRQVLRSPGHCKGQTAIHARDTSRRPPRESLPRADRPGGCTCS